MTREEAIEIIKDLYHDIEDSDIELHEETRLISCSCNVIKISSLNLLNWLIKIEKKFDIEITEDDQLIKDIVDKIIRTDKKENSQTNLAEKATKTNKK